MIHKTTSTSSIVSPCGKMCEVVLQGDYPVVGHFGDDSARLVRCSHCGYMVFDPLPTEEMLTAYYTGEYWDPERSAAEARTTYELKDFSETVATIKNAWTAIGGDITKLKVHDIGCGYGGVVNALTMADVKAIGTDLSETSIAAANQNKNHSVYRRTLEEHLPSAEAKGVNMFFMSHSLEHMPRPRDVLQQVRDALPNQGLALIRVPNGAYIAAMLSRYVDYTWFQYPAHIHYFTPASAYSLFEASGLHILDVRTLVREDHQEQLWGKLFGKEPRQLPDRIAILKALADNGLAMELQIIACRNDSSLCEASPFTGGLPRDGYYEIPGNAETWRDSNVVTQAQAEFVTGGKAGADAPWQYSYQAIDGKIYEPSWDAKQTCWIAPDGSRLHSNYTFSSPDVEFRLSKAIRSGQSVVRVRAEACLPYGEKGNTAINVYRNGDFIDNKVGMAGSRETLSILLRVSEGDVVTIGFEVKNSEWPSLYYGAAVEAVSIR